MALFHVPVPRESPGLSFFSGPAAVSPRRRSDTESRSTALCRRSGLLQRQGNAAADGIAGGDPGAPSSRIYAASSPAGGSGGYPGVTVMKERA